MTTNPKPNKALKVGKKAEWVMLGGRGRLAENCAPWDIAHTWLFFFTLRHSYKWVLIQIPTICREVKNGRVPAIPERSLKSLGWRGG